MLVVNAATRVAIYDSQRVDLSPREAKLLSMFVDDSGRVLSRDEIVDEVWRGRAASPRAVDVIVFRLRMRLKRIGHPGIQTVFGRGYRLAV
jgi:DNA-binding winged helix-turn-helix (wHTH) protein